MENFRCASRRGITGYLATGMVAGNQERHDASGFGIRSSADKPGVHSARVQPELNTLPRRSFWRTVQLTGRTGVPSSQRLPDHTFPGPSTLNEVTAPYAAHLVLLPRWNT